MIKRTIEISREPTHLAVRDNQLLVVRKDEGSRSGHFPPGAIAAQIPCEDLGIVVVDEGQSTYTHAALCQLAQSGAAVVICGADHLPCGVLLPTSEHTELVWRQADQINAGMPLKKRLWQKIVRAKIEAQARALGPGASGAVAVLRRMARDVTSGDAENHEAQAARVYWSAWLGNVCGREGTEFVRDASPGVHAPAPNNFLNYGYAVIRAAVARALVGAGLLASVGIKHRHRSNAFCLADDLMEPLRPLVDVVARELFQRGETGLTQHNKSLFLLLLTAPMVMRGAGNSAVEGPLMVSLHRYAASFAMALATGEWNQLEIPVRSETTQKDAQGFSDDGA